MKLILAITACPTGIAHTYMAAESLEKAGKAAGVKIKVETNGSIGAENVLTQEEIKEAYAIIIAADTRVEMARFDGKKLKEYSVSDAIKKPDEMIKEALSGEYEEYESY